MNNKGFAISIILYSLVFLLIAIFYMLLGILKNRYTTSNDLREDIIEELNSASTLGEKVYKLCDRVSYVKTHTEEDEVTDSFSDSNDSNICVYINSDTNNLANKYGNVVFGNYCWKIIRTTSDGGVKLLYNGPKTSDNKCPEDSSQRPSSIGLKGSSATTTTLSGTMRFGTDFSYNNGSFTINNSFTANWDTDYERIIGTYTCKNNSTSCTTLYYIGGYKDATTAETVTYKLENNEVYSQIGTSAFNAFSNSLSQVGYMYNEKYNYSSKPADSFFRVLDGVMISDSDAYYYGDTAVWNSSTNQYDLKVNGETPTKTTTWKNIKTNVKGKYTCKSSTATSCETVHYVADNYTNSNYIISIPLSNNENVDTKTVTWTLGTGYTENNGTYTLTGVTTKTILLKDFPSTYGQYKDLYMCSDFTSATCSNLYYFYQTANYLIRYNSTEYKYLFGNSVTYQDGKYTINVDSDPAKYHVAWQYGKSGEMSQSHYTCFTTDTNECGDSVYYVHYISTGLYHLKLTNGEKIENALDKMINYSNSGISTLNKYNSAIKGVLENWYRQNILYRGLSEYIDSDAVFCNDRSVNALNGLSPNGNPLNSVQFSKYGLSRNLSCKNVTDQFSVNNTLAKLEYPVGLLTLPERMIAGADYVKNGQKWWIMTPNYYISSGSNYIIVEQDNSLTSSSGDTSLGVRPVIVLKGDVEVTGIGTYDEPFVVYLEPASE